MSVMLLTKQLNVNLFFKYVPAGKRELVALPGAPAGKRGLAAQGLKDFFNHSSRGNTFLFLEC
jgi:hypothetical protein